MIDADGPDLALAVSALVHEPVIRTIEKAGCVVVLTESLAVKIRAPLDDAAAVLAHAEASWLDRHSAVPCEVVELSIGSTGVVAVIMPRFPDDACAGRMLAEGRLTTQDVYRVLDRLDGLSQDPDRPSMSRAALAQRLLLNFDRQLTLMPGLSAAPWTAPDLKALLTRWSDRAGADVIAAHGNAFSPNIFLSPSAVAIIDPRLRNADVATLPAVGDVATFCVDLLFHRWPLQHVVSVVQRHVREHDLDAFIGVMVVKALVRCRFAAMEAANKHENWRSAQIRTILDGLPGVLEILRDGPSLSPGRRSDG